MDKYEESRILTKRHKKIKRLLKSVFGYDDFKPKQYEIINKIVSGEDVCAILPTGYGKSLTYQIPALYLNKPAIVISPLISLMDDQRIILEKLGITSCCYNSQASDRGVLRKDIMANKYQFIYITPESIQGLKDFFVTLERQHGISLIAIDEAHCISSYGFDFRKSYRELTFFKDILPSTPILAVTATATKMVGKDICKILGFKNTHPIKTSFNRANLYLEIRQKGKDIGSDIVPLIRKYEGKSVIIYCLTKKETEKIAEILKIHGIKCGVYHAGLSIETKTKAHVSFIKGKTKVIAATIAFGMGINKANVRSVIHYGCPKNLEGYYQEIGRAGRDGKKAYCYTFYSYRDFKMQESFIANCNNAAYQETQMGLLGKMKHYVMTRHCRRKLLLEYFDEDMDDEECDFCDNCCHVSKKENDVIKTKQNVENEAKMLIDLIESIKNRNFGVGMFIDILRGSNSKRILPTMKQSPYYGKGVHRSVGWWKEMSESLITDGFLQNSYVKGSAFAMQVIKVTQKGVSWSTMNELSGILGGNAVEMKSIEMTTTV